MFQLYSLKETAPYVIDNAGKIVLIADLFNYFLTGVKSADYTMASTTALIDVKSRDWSAELFDTLGIDKDLMCDIVMPGTVIGELSDAVCDELMVDKAKVVSVASHDTASAVMAVPTNEPDVTYISCGTWSLFGIELEEEIEII